MVIRDRTWPDGGTYDPNVWCKPWQDKNGDKLGYD